MTIVLLIVKWFVERWDLVAAFILGAGGIKGAEAVIAKWKAWLAARAAKAEATVEADTKNLEAVVDARIKAALADIVKKT